MDNQGLKKIVSYLKTNNLKLTTAESCTAGKIIHLLGKLPKSGEVLEAGFVVYSKEAKLKILGVKNETINKFTLTSEEVAREMVYGALKLSNGNIAISTTGIAGSKPMDGVAAGTICFAWSIKNSSKNFIVSETVIFSGTQAKKQALAAAYALEKIPFYFNQYKALGENSSVFS